MTQILSDAALCAAPLPTAPGFALQGLALLAAARGLLPSLEAGRPIDAATLRAAMSQAFGGTDAEGAWDWKQAYDAGEAAQILFLRKYWHQLTARSASPSSSRRRRCCTG